MFVLLVCLVLPISCVKLRMECNEKWNIEYYSDADFIKHLVIIEMVDKDMNENFDCFYRIISQKTIPLAIFKETFGMNITNGFEKEDELASIEMKYLDRSHETAFMVLMPYPEIRLALQSNFLKIFRRYTRALIFFIFYNDQMQLSEPVEDDLKIKLTLFSNTVFEKFRFIHFIGVLLDSTRSIFFKFDLNKIDSDWYFYGLTFSPKSFNCSLVLKKSFKMRENFPVKITMFEKLPAAIKPSPSKWFKNLEQLVPQLGRVYGGKDGFLITDIVTHLKLKPLYLTPKGVEPFGAFYSNGSMTGVLGDIVRHIADISANSRFLTSYDVDDKYYFLGYNHFDRICAVVAKYNRIPIWIIIILTYSILIWSLLFLQLALITGLRWFHLNFILDYKKSIIDVSLETFFSQIVPIHGLQKSFHKVLLIVSVITSTLFIPILQGNISSAFTKRQYYHDINTLEELDQHYLKIHITSLIDKRLVFGSGISDLFDRLDGKTDLTDLGFQELLAVTAERRIPFITSETDFRVLINSRNNLAAKVYILKECPREYLYAFICSTSFPWAEEVEMTILRLVAAGLPTWYYTMTELCVKTYELTESQQDTQALRLDMLKVPFVMFSAGAALSVTAFVCEIILRRK